VVFLLYLGQVKEKRQIKANMRLPPSFILMYMDIENKKQEVKKMEHAVNCRCSQT
jgi:hypothetical protein